MQFCLHKLMNRIESKCDCQCTGIDSEECYRTSFSYSSAIRTRTAFAVCIQVHRGGQPLPCSCPVARTLAPAKITALEDQSTAGCELSSSLCIFLLGIYQRPFLHVVFQPSLSLSLSTQNDHLYNYEYFTSVHRSR